MATITIKNATHEDCVLAAGVVGKCKVVHCPNPADAASPVTLVAGDFSLPIGQSADYRHDLSGLPAANDAGALVESYWDNATSAWYTTITTNASEEAIRDFIRNRNAKRDAAQAQKRKIEAEQKAQQQAQDFRAAVDAAISAVSAVAELWAPGRVHVKRANDGQIIAGRWDEPNIPGYGRPVEVRRAIRRDGQIELVTADQSYAYSWN